MEQWQGARVPDACFLWCDVGSRHGRRVGPDACPIWNNGANYVTQPTRRRRGAMLADQSPGHAGDSDSLSGVEGLCWQVLTLFQSRLAKVQAGLSRIVDASSTSPRSISNIERFYLEMSSQHTRGATLKLSIDFWTHPSNILSHSAWTLPCVSLSCLVCGARERDHRQLASGSFPEPDWLATIDVCLEQGATTRGSSGNGALESTPGST